MSKLDPYKDKVEARLQEQVARKPWTVAWLLLAGAVVGSVLTTLVLRFF